MWVCLSAREWDRGGWGGGSKTTRSIPAMSTQCLYSQIRNNQQRMICVLEAKKIPFQKVDIAKDHIGRALLKQICKQSNPQPPIITKGEQYLGVSK